MLKLIKDMRFSIKNNTGLNIVLLMKRIGYHYFAQNSFIRPVGQSFYPRFHIYLKEDTETQEISFNIHIDQKRPIYSGSIAHNGEYEGEILEKEVERIKNNLLKNV